MQTSKINYVTESTIIAIGNKAEKTVSKVAKKVSEAVKPAEKEFTTIPISSFDPQMDPQMSYALSHGCVPDSEVGQKLNIIV